ncbi:hypothetical protein V1506DRAFT_529946 [Lipomyces tetrasporus]
MRNGHVANLDCFVYRIASSGRPGCNPVLNSLRKLRLLNDKSGGIPSSYMTADESTRLAVIAGLMDSDGTCRKSRNTYQFAQMTEGHKKLCTT